jgi:hypothetical protein
VILPPLVFPGISNARSTIVTKIRYLKVVDESASRHNVQGTKISANFSKFSNRRKVDLPISASPSFVDEFSSAFEEELTQFGLKFRRRIDAPSFIFGFLHFRKRVGLLIENEEKRKELKGKELM